MACDSFPLFVRLPEELRRMVWQLSLPPPEPEVCIACPLNAGGQPPNFTAILPLTVDTAFSALMHVCRESRRFAESTSASGIRYRTSEVAGCLVPFRPFIPELDTFYIARGTVPAAKALILRHRELASTIQHVAVDGNLARNPALRAVLPVARYCPILESLSVVLPQTLPPPDDQGKVVSEMWRFPQPYRRCKLALASDELPESLPATQFASLFGTGEKYDVWCSMTRVLRRHFRHKTMAEGPPVPLPMFKAKVFNIRGKNGVWIKGYKDQSKYAHIKEPPGPGMDRDRNPEISRVIERDGIWEEREQRID